MGADRSRYAVINGSWYPAIDQPPFSSPLGPKSNLYHLRLMLPPPSLPLLMGVTRTVWARTRGVFTVLLRISLSIPSTGTPLGLPVLQCRLFAPKQLVFFRSLSICQCIFLKLLPLSSSIVSRPLPASSSFSIKSRQGQIIRLPTPMWCGPVWS